MVRRREGSKALTAKRSRSFHNVVKKPRRHGKVQTLRRRNMCQVACGIMTVDRVLLPLAFIGVALTATLSLRSNSALSNGYEKRILVANRAGFEKDALIDPHLINPWG